MDDALNKAKDYAGENPDKVDAGVDAESQKAQDRAPDAVDDRIDAGADRLKDRAGGGGDESGNQPNESQGA